MSDPKQKFVLITLALVFGMFRNSRCQDSDPRDRDPISEPEENPEISGDYFEGDMIIDESYFKNSVLFTGQYRWPDKNVKFRISEKFSDEQRDHIMRAIRILESTSCLKFTEDDGSGKTYLNIEKHPTSCFSEVGYQGRAQHMSLGDHEIGKGCFRLGSILHQLLHVLGFVHQVNAPNRDKYVRIIKSNVLPHSLHMFDKNPEEAYDCSDTTGSYEWRPNCGDDAGKAIFEKYDYDSVLHHSPASFGKDGKKTIVPKLAGDYDIGQRVGLSILDIKKLNLVYECHSL